MKTQGYFGKDIGRQTRDLETSTRQSVDDASKAHRFKTQRVSEQGESVQVKAGGFYTTTSVTDTGKGTKFIFPDPRETPGERIAISSVKDTPDGPPHTRITVVPGGEYRVDGETDGKTITGRKLMVEFIAQDNDWVLSSKGVET